MGGDWIETDVQTGRTRFCRIDQIFKDQFTQSWADFKTHVEQRQQEQKEQRVAAEKEQHKEQEAANDEEVAGSDDEKPLVATAKAGSSRAAAKAQGQGKGGKKGSKGKHTMGQAREGGLTPGTIVWGDVYLELCLGGGMRHHGDG